MNSIGVGSHFGCTCLFGCHAVGFRSEAGAAGLRYAGAVGLRSEVQYLRGVTLFHEQSQHETASTIDCWKHHQCSQNLVVGHDQNQKSVQAAKLTVRVVMETISTSPTPLHGGGCAG